MEQNSNEFNAPSRGGEPTGIGDGTPGLTSGMGAFQARNEPEGLGERAREKASEFGGRVGDQLRNRGSGGLESAAGAIDRASSWAEERGGAMAKAAPAARSVADALEQSARYLREQDLETMRTDVEEEIRGYPLRSALIAIGIGFVIGRMIR